jgi:hypothetical protein
MPDFQIWIDPVSLLLSLVVFWKAHQSRSIAWFVRGLGILAIALYVVLSGQIPQFIWRYVLLALVSVNVVAAMELRRARHLTGLFS